MKTPSRETTPAGPGPTAAAPLAGRVLRGLDHVAIVVPDTAAALALWRDRLGFPVVCQEAVNAGSVLLTHLDLGNIHLQLVQPLTPEHPLHAWLQTHGAGLHHVCFSVDDVDGACAALAAAGLPAARPHQGTRGNRAAFLDGVNTGGVRLEVTGR